MSDHPSIIISHIFRRFGNENPKKEFLRIYNNEFRWLPFLKENGIKTICIVGANEDGEEQNEFGNIYFVKDKIRSSALSHSLSFYQTAAKILEDEKVQIVHLHNLSFVISHFLLKSYLLKNLPLIVQDHGTIYSGKYRLLRKLYWIYSKIIFNSKGQEELWLKNNIFQKSKVDFVLENSTSFISTDKSLARSKTGLQGNPVFISVGHLVMGKDPMLIIKGISSLVSYYPSAKFYFVFRKTDLKNEILNFIQKQNLEKKVILLGEKTHEEVESLLNSADYIISASRKESAGYSVLEAMACGTIPILSDIPSFIHFTNQGEVGTNFKAGDVDDFVNQTRLLLNESMEDQYAKVLERFKTNLSPNIVARQTITLYKTVLASKVKAT